MRISKKATALIVLFGFAASLSLIGYVYLSSPREVVISQQGEVVGDINKARALLQGEHFWDNQLLETKKELEEQKSAIERTVERKIRIDASLERTKKIMVTGYERQPNTRPSPATQQAEALRDAADDIEQAELDQYIEKLRLLRISSLGKIIQIIEDRNQRN